MLKTVLIVFFKTFVFILLVLILLVAIMAAGGYWLYEYRFKTPLPITAEYRYEIPSNTRLYQVAQDLVAHEWVSYPVAMSWVLWARVQGQAHQIKAGEYALPVGTNLLTLLELFVEGKSIQYALTLVEGWNFRQVMAVVHEHPHLTHTLKGLDNEAIMAKLGWPNQHPEGQFFPDTYLFPDKTTDVDFLQRAYQLMQRELTAAWQQRQANLPFETAYDALILASIVEKETAVASERPMIAGVFIQRLKKGMPLQTDPTVIYALGEHFDGNIRKADLKVDSPYNTYVYKGLPPTPIAMPGRQALQAAVQPAPGEALYFVAKNDGSHYFSESYSEHRCAVIEYQLKHKASQRYQQYCQRYPHCSACRS